MAPAENAGNSNKAATNVRNEHEKPRASEPLVQRNRRQHIESSSTQEQPPPYTQNGLNVFVEIEQLATTLRREDGSGLPITAFPQLAHNGTSKELEESCCRRHIVDMYFNAISKADMQLIATLLDAGLVTTETTNSASRTALLAAVEAGKVAVVRFLLGAGANVNTFGIVARSVHRPNRANLNDQCYIYRTPLQYAAQLGNLAIVKLLMENDADHGLIAQDGQLALRLAASNGHREIVKYLPRRRGGGFKRWKAKHTTAMRRCKRATQGIYKVAKFCTWDLPKFFVWTIPKHAIILPLVRSAKWVYAHWDELPTLIKKYAKIIRDDIKGIARFLWRLTRDIPSLTVRASKAIGRWSKALARSFWVLIKRLPNAVKILLAWLWAGVKKYGTAIGKVFASIFSFLHTLCTAINSFFKQITLQDVWRGLVACLYAVFINTPQKIWGWMCALEDLVLKVLNAIFGCVGKFIWELIKCLCEAVLYVPKKFCVVLAACGSSLRSGGKEVLVWIDPKRV